MITVIGSLNYDLVTYTDRVPGGGETFQADAFETHIGGKGLNEAIAVARLTASQDGAKVQRVRMIGRVGDDGFGKELIDALKGDGVDTTFIDSVPNTKSGVAVILVEAESGENRILITSGANGTLQPTNSEYEQYFPPEICGTDYYVILQNEYPDTLKTIEWLKVNRPAVNICYNPSPFKKEWVSSVVLASIDLIIVNEGEASDIASVLGLHHKENCDIATLAEFLQRALAPNGISTVIITLGSKGCVYTNKDISPPLKADSVKVSHVVDTTGAGDTFFGGVVLQLSQAKSLHEAITFATRASSLAIQKHGAAESIPTFDDITEGHFIN